MSYAAETGLLHRLPARDLHQSCARHSRFLVADFTHGTCGARGSVYYETGFAYGLGLPVIYTCRNDLVEKLHFDTRQYYHIAWERPDELRDGLEKRILALVGEGPNR